MQELDQVEYAVPQQLIHTICHGCVFNVGAYTVGTINTYLEQTGCSAGQLEVAPQKQLVEDQSTGELFYLLDGFPCKFKRDKQWADSIKDENKVEKATEEVGNARSTFTVLCALQETIDNPQFISFVEKLNAQTYLPNEIVFLLATKDYPKRSWMCDYLKNNSKVKWRVVSDMSKDVLEMIDLAVKSIKTTYYLLLNIKDEFRPTFLQELEEKDRIEKKEFFALEPINDKLSYLVVMTYLHYLFGGNKKAEINKEYSEEILRTDSIIDKLKFILKEHKKEEYVRTYSEIGLITP